MVKEIVPPPPFRPPFDYWHETQKRPQIKTPGTVVMMNKVRELSNDNIALIENEPEPIDLFLTGALGGLILGAIYIAYLIAFGITQ